MSLIGKDMMELEHMNTRHKEEEIQLMENSKEETKLCLPIHNTQLQDQNKIDLIYKHSQLLVHLWHQIIKKYLLFKLVWIAIIIS
jgi:hypothetical protein